MFKILTKYILLAAALMLAPSAASAAASYPFIKPDIASVEAMGAACGTTVAGVWVPNYGHYAWNGTSTATADGVNVLQCTGVATGRMIIDPGFAGKVYANVAAIDCTSDLSCAAIPNITIQSVSIGSAVALSAQYAWSASCLSGETPDAAIFVRPTGVVTGCYYLTGWGGSPPIVATIADAQTLISSGRFNAVTVTGTQGDGDTFEKVACGGTAPEPSCTPDTGITFSIAGDATHVLQRQGVGATANPQWFTSTVLANTGADAISAIQSALDTGLDVSSPKTDILTVDPTNYGTGNYAALSVGTSGQKISGSFKKQPFATSSTFSTTSGATTVNCSGCNFVASDATNHAKLYVSGVTWGGGSAGFTDINTVNSSTQVVVADAANSTVSSTAGGYGYANNIFYVPDNVDNVQFDVDIQGDKATSYGGMTGAGILSVNNSGLSISPTSYFHDFIDDGIKIWNATSMNVPAAARFDNIYNAGVEPQCYGFDPRTSAAWASTTYCYPLGRISGIYTNIDDGRAGAGNGVGINFNACPSGCTVGSAPFFGGLQVANLQCYNVVRCIWSENNVSGHEAYDVTISNPIINGFINGDTTGTTISYQGIGGVSLRNWTISNPIIRDLSYSGLANSAGILISQSGGTTQNVIINNPQITDDRGTPYMDYGVLASYGTNITVNGGALSGAVTANLSVGGTVTNFSAPSGIEGATAQPSWGPTVIKTFTLAASPAGSTNAMCVSGLYNYNTSTCLNTDTQLGVSNAPVSFCVQASAAISGGDGVTFRLYANGVDVMDIPDSTFGGGGSACVSLNRSASTILTNVQRYRVDEVTTAGWTKTTLTAEATVGAATQATQ